MVRYCYHITTRSEEASRTAYWLSLFHLQRPLKYSDASAYHASRSVRRPARMLAGSAMLIFEGGGTFLPFIISTKAVLSMESFRRSLNCFSSWIVDDILPL